MTSEEAKDILNCTATDSCDLCTTNIKHGGDCKCQYEFYEALQMSISALEKNIPKKPNNKQLKYGGLSFYYCPKCNAEVSLSLTCGGGYDYKLKYCSECGQHIDWRDVNDQ